MPLLAATNLKHAYGDDIVLDGISLSIEAGERVGVVGRNGAGKSTLMKALAGLVKPDSGEVSIARGRRAGYLHQDPKLDPEETLRDAAEGAFAELHRLHQELHGVYEEMATASGADLDRLMRKQERLEGEIEAAGGYTIDHKIDATLHGLGLTDKTFGVKCKALSGGQRGRLALARLLLESPDVLLLDEPTNHLDIDGRLWLEDFLKNEYRGAVLMITHDRVMLDSVVQRILEVEQARLIDYPGNYEAFREIRLQRRLTQGRAFEKQQTKFKKEEEFIRRFRAGQRAKEAQGRQTKLEREKRSSTLERPMELESFRLELPKAPRAGEVVVSARVVSKSYAVHRGDVDEDGPISEDGMKVLFKGLDVSIGRGERWGIIGPNGAGKTTLVRVLLGEIAPDEGQVRLGVNVVVGHYRQTDEGMDSEREVYRFLQDAIRKENPQGELSEQQARNLAGAFLFSGSEQEKPTYVLSGGEKSRLRLAALLASAKNLLVLDEPTNHLDIPSAERLEESLTTSPDEGGYEGAMILISHDRALIDATCDHLIVLDGHGGAEVFTGNYSAWSRRRAEREAAGKAEADALKAAEEDRQKKARAAEEAAKRTRAPDAARQPGRSALERMSMEKLEAKIEELQRRVKSIDKELQSPDVWRDAARSNRLGEDRQRALSELEPLEFEWSRRAETA